MTFAVRQNIIPFNLASTGLTIKKVTTSRGQRKEFSKEDLTIINNELKDSTLYPLIQIFRYSGMRLSELYKCTINEIDDILCFDLRNPQEPLKTLH